MKNLVSRILNRIVVEYLSLRSKQIMYLEVGRSNIPSWASRVSKYSDSVEIATPGALTDVSVHHYFQQRWLYELKNVYLQPGRGDVFSERGELIIESSNWHPYFPNPSRRRARNSELLPCTTQPYLYLASWTYFHFLIENLPSFLASRMQFPLSPVIIAQDSPNYVIEALDLLNILPLRVEAQVKVSNLVLCSKGPDTGWAHPQDVELIRSTFKKSMKRQEKGKSVYISRANSTRSPDNEKLLIENLSKLGIEIVSSEKLNLQEQIGLFSSADLLIGIHGAGLANQVWMEPGSHVIEIIDESYFNICFEALAQVAGHHYAEVIYNSRSNNPALPVDRIIQKIQSVRQL